MEPSRRARTAFAAFTFWPMALGAVLANVTWFAFGYRGWSRIIGLAWILAGFGANWLWVYYCDHAGLSDRIHDALGSTQNPYTGLYGATRAEIEADTERVRRANSADKSSTP